MDIGVEYRLRQGDTGPAFSRDGNITFHEVKVCPLCGETSLFWNCFTANDECFNPECTSHPSLAPARSSSGTVAEWPRRPAAAAHRARATAQPRAAAHRAPAESAAQPGFAATLNPVWGTVLTIMAILFGIGLILYAVMSYDDFGIVSVIIIAAASILTTWNLLTFTFALRENHHVRLSEIMAPAAATLIMVLVEIGFGVTS